MGITAASSGSPSAYKLTKVVTLAELH